MKHPLADWANWEELIRQGQTGEVRSELARINVKKLKREQFYAISNFARRVGLAELSVRILRPVVRQQKTKIMQASPREAAEYGAALVRIGAVREGMSILESIDPKEHLEVLILRAIGQFNRWEHELAIPPLERYLAVSRDSYQRLVAQINLIAALIFCKKLQEAGDLLNQAEEECMARGLLLLRGTCLELKAQLLLNEERYDEAAAFLGNSTSIVQDSGQRQGLWIRKWMALIDDRRAPRVGAPALRAIREEAGLARDWETVRDCDYHASLITGDRSLMIHLFCGTPFEGYRKRLRILCPTIPDFYDWNPSGEPGGRVLDVVQGIELGTKIHLKPGLLLHRLLGVLSADFYRPSRLASIFSELFPEEYYDPWSSPDRIFRSIQRLRAWFKEAGLPATIEDQKGAYRLLTTGPYSFRVSSSRREVAAPTDSREMLQRLFGERSFTRAEAEAGLGLSKAGTQLLLNAAVRDGWLLKTGASSSTRYQIVRSRMLQVTGVT